MRRTWNLLFALLLAACLAAPAPATVTDLVPRAEYISTGGATYSCVDTASGQGFPIWEKTDLEVYVDGVLQTVDTDYTVSFTAGDPSDCSITFTTAPSSGAKVVIIRDHPHERTTDFGVSGPFSMSALNEQLDRLTAQVQDLEADVYQALKLNPGSTASPVELGDPTPNRVLMWDDSGNRVVAADPSGLSLAASPIQAVVGNISALLSTTPIADGYTVFVKGYHTPGDGGGGVFYWDETEPKSSHNGGTIIDPGRTFPTDWSDTSQQATWFTAAASGQGCWKRIYSGEVNVRWFGAKGDDTTDDKQPFQQAFNANAAVVIPKGDYYCSNTISLNAYQYISGVGLPVIRFDAGVTGFQWHFTSGGSTPYDVHRAFDIIGLNIKADYPIVINDTSTYIAGGTGDCVPLDCVIANNVLEPVTSLTGIGITASKLFDSIIINNYIKNFDIGILLHGCDLNLIRDNRIQTFNSFGIFEQSAQSFGSQNTIEHNDILNGGTSSIYISTSSRMVTIHDNYLERSGSDAVVGFIDISKDNAKTFGSNTPVLPYTISVVDNRIDGQGNATSYVYNLDLTGDTVYCRVIDRNTTGVKGDSVIDSPLVRKDTRERYFEIIGETFPDDWQNYKTSGRYDYVAGKLVMNGANTPAIINKDQNTKLKLRGRVLIIPASGVSATDTFWLVPSDSNVFLANSAKTYTCRIIARTTSGSGDTLRAAIGWDGGGDGLNDFNLTTDFREYMFTFTGKSASYTKVGVYMRRSTFNGDIEIVSVSLE